MSSISRYQARKNRLKNFNLAKMILKNSFSREKVHYPSPQFIEFYDVKDDEFLMNILNKQTDNKYKK